MTRKNAVRVACRVVGPIETNCYILACSETGKAVIVDPGGDGDVIEEFIRTARLRVDVLSRFLRQAAGGFRRRELPQWAIRRGCWQPTTAKATANRTGAARRVESMAGILGSPSGRHNRTLDGNASSLNRLKHSGIRAVSFFSTRAHAPASGRHFHR